MSHMTDHLTTACFELTLYSREQKLIQIIGVLEVLLDLPGQGQVKLMHKLQGSKALKEKKTTSWCNWRDHTG